MSLAVDVVEEMAASALQKFWEANSWTDCTERRLCAGWSVNVSVFWGGVLEVESTDFIINLTFKWLKLENARADFIW